jgi:hypothetical protein
MILRPLAAMLLTPVLAERRILAGSPQARCALLRATGDELDLDSRADFDHTVGRQLEECGDIADVVQHHREEPFAP